MVEGSAIEWTDHTFNAWLGCTKVGPGCDHCYAEALATSRLGVPWGPGAPRRRTKSSTWSQPRRWDRRAGETGVRERVFCSSLADVFDNEVPPEWRADLFALIRATPNLDWLLVTKRIGNVEKMIAGSYLPENVWLGATVVNQAEAERDIPKLAAVEAAVRFLSIEPMLGPIDLGTHLLYQPCDNSLDGLTMDPSTGAYECCSRCDWTGIGDVLAINWIIAGGESGPGARPSHPDWFRSLRDQCAQANVPFLFKQWGEWAPISEIDLDAQDGLYRPMLARHRPEGPRRCKVAQCVLHADGTRFDKNEWSRIITELPGVLPFNAGSGAMTMMQIGKARAGRILDGISHDGMPGR